jgi:hypothetical protein
MNNDIEKYAHICWDNNDLRQNRRTISCFSGRIAYCRGKHAPFTRSRYETGGLKMRGHATLSGQERSMKGHS